MSPSRADALLSVLLGGAAFLSGASVLVILLFVAREAAPALWEVGPVRFFTDRAWRPASSADGQFGLLPMLAGSALVTAGAMALAGPIGLLSAIFARFYAPPPLAILYRRAIELFAGIPSVVFGFWGLVVLVPQIARIESPGQSLLAGALVLAFMIVPTMAMTAEAALASVPQGSLQAAAALGLGRWTTVSKIALPAARGGIIVGLLLAAARAVGETMAVVMVCGNIVQIPHSPFAPVRTVTANIALEMGYATAAHRSALFVTALMLILAILAAFFTAEWLRGRGEDG